MEGSNKREDKATLANFTIKSILPHSRFLFWSSNRPAHSAPAADDNHHWPSPAPSLSKRMLLLSTSNACSLSLNIGLSAARREVTTSSLPACLHVVCCGRPSLPWTIWGHVPGYPTMCDDRPTARRKKQCSQREKKQGKTRGKLIRKWQSRIRKKGKRSGQIDQKHVPRRRHSQIQIQKSNPDGKRLQTWP